MSRPSLEGAGVLVTRARDQAASLVTAIEEAGGRAFLLPALEIAPLAPPPGVGGPQDLVVFVSPNAVRYGAELLEAPRRQLAAIGPATAAALGRAGHPPDLVPTGGYDSESLLAEDQLTDMQDRSVLIVRGHGGRELLAETLRERGAKVGYAEVYERRLPAVAAGELEAVMSAWRAGGLRFVTCLSVATLRNLMELLGEQAREVLRGTTLVSVSERVLQIAVREDIAVDTLLSQGPEPSDLVRAMVSATGYGTERSMSEHDKSGSKTTTDAGSADSARTEEPTGEATATGPEAAVHGAESDPGQSGAATEKPGPDATGGGLAAEAEEPPPPPATRGPGRSIAVVAWLALAIALFALGFGGYRWWLERTADDQTTGLQTAIAGLREDDASNASAISRVEGSLASLQQSLEGAADAGALARLEREFRAGRDLVESLPGRMQNLEESMANLQGVSAGARDAWLVAEAEYYMQLANGQAQLAGNAELAAFALELADRRIRELGDPVYTPVRRQLADEIAALRAVEDIDVEGVSLTLASLADITQSLPLNEDVTPEQQPRAEIDSALSGLQRAWAAAKNAFSEMIRVRRTDEQLEPLLSPEAQYFLRTNIALQLQTARLALLKGEAAIFRQSVQDAESWLQRYFDTETNAVSGAIQTLAEIRDSKVSSELPDISASLRLFRQQQAIAEGAG